MMMMMVVVVVKVILGGKVLSNLSHLLQGGGGFEHEERERHQRGHVGPNVLGELAPELLSLLQGKAVTYSQNYTHGLASCLVQVLYGNMKVLR